MILVLTFIFPPFLDLNCIRKMLYFQYREAGASESLASTRLNPPFSDKRIRWILSFEKGWTLLRNTHSWKSIYEFVPISQENLSAFTGSRALRASTRGFLPLVNSLIGINDDLPLFFLIFENLNTIDELFLLVKATSMYFVNALNHEYLEKREEVGLIPNLNFYRQDYIIPDVED